MDKLIGLDVQLFRDGPWQFGATQGPVFHQNGTRLHPRRADVLTKAGDYRLAFFHPDGVDKGALSRCPADNTLCRQRLQGLSGGHTADSVVLAELILRHDLIPGFELTGLDLVPDLIGYFFIFRNFMRHIQ